MIVRILGNNALNPPSSRAPARRSDVLAGSTRCKRSLQVLGLFNPLLREVVEMHYLQTQPVFLNDMDLQHLLGPLSKTSYEQGVRAVLEAEAA